MEEKLYEYINGTYINIIPNNDAECAIIKYGLLKYPNYVLNYKFGKNDFLDGVAMFSLLVYNHPIDIYPKIIPDISLLVLSYASIDDFPIPSYESCIYINKNKTDDNWYYFLSGWNILGNYNLEREIKLFYHSDHFYLAKKYNKTLPNKYNIILYDNGYYINTYTDVKINNEDGDKLFVNFMMLKSYNFKDIKPTLNNICLLESNNWQSEYSTYVMNYNEMKGEKNMFMF